MTGAARDPGTSADFRYTTSTDMTCLPPQRLNGALMRLKLTAVLCAAITLSVGVPAWGAGAPGDEGAVSADMVGEMASLAVGTGSWSQAFAPFTLGNGREFPDQTDQQALAVAARQDPSLFAASSTRILDPPGGATVERYLDDFSARIDIPGQGPDVIAKSTTPVRVEENGVKRAVDLKLVDVGDAIEPKTPVVALSFADTLGGGITIAENIRMRIVGADRSAVATIAGQQVFYANALKDADVFAMPLPAGLETFVQLRSSASPKTITYQFDLPKGARLVALPGEHAGIAIVRGDDLLAMIDAPVSKDANDVVVPTTTSIEGTRLSLHVAADDSTAYPILVDPVVTDNQFLNGDSASSYGQFQNTLGWRRETSGALGNFTFAPNADNPGSGGSCYRIVNNAWVPLDRQLCVSTQNTRTYPGEIGQWAWRPPGGSRTYLNDGAGITFDGYVYRAFVRHSYTRFTGSRGAYMFAGIKSGRTGQWIGMNRNIQQSGVADDVRYGPWTFGENTTTSISNPSFLRDYCANTACSPESTDPNIDGASFAFGTYALGYGHALSANAQGAVFYQYDRTPPSVTHASNSDLSVWKNSGTVDTVVSSSDKGMGIKRVGITGGSNASITSACTGGILSTCPQNPPATTISTNLADLSDGIQQITGYAEDILGKRTNATPPLTVKIDRTAPELELGGTLALAFSDPRFRGLYDAEHTLTVTARDEDSQRPESGAVSVSAELRRTDGSVVTSASKAQACAAGQNCPLSLPQPYVVRTDEVPDGAYNVVVKAADAAGNSTERMQDVIIDRRGDIYTARKLVSYLAEQEDDSRAVEWARVGTHDARVETDDHVSTRTTVTDAGAQYDEVRYVSRNGQVRDPDTGELDPNAEESITVDKGAGTSDPELDIVADILQPAYDLAAGNTQADGGGPLDQALANGQAPPPNHGTTYTAYESEPTPFEDQHGISAPRTVARVTVDTQTKMPIRQTVTNIDTNQLLLSIRYIYELDRLQSSEVDPAFFREPTPANVGTSEESRATGAQMPATVQDSDTGQTFAPYQLGLSLTWGPRHLPSNRNRDRQPDDLRSDGRR